jgi:Tol biopolymer transport system component
MGRTSFTVRRASVVALATVFAHEAPAQQPLSRASVDSNGAEANGDSGYRTPSVSADGRFVAFTSFASNLVAGDTNLRSDVFVRDRLLGVTVRVSVDSSGAEGNDESDSSVLSPDGRFVAFTSVATNLVANDTNHAQDVFLHDRDPDGNGIFDEGNGVTLRVSVGSNGVEANSASLVGGISADGMRIAFSSIATNLVPGDHNGASDVFGFDRSTQTTVRASVDSAGNEADGDSSGGVLSEDGLTVAFESIADNLVPGDSNQITDVFVRDLFAKTTVRASVDSSGNEGNDLSTGASLSGDGRFVLFTSRATNLVANDTNGAYDAFLRDLATGTTERVSVGASGVQGNAATYIGGALSYDGSVVVFPSLATNLAGNDANSTYDVFVRDRGAGTTSLMSRTPWDASEGGTLPAVSRDGTVVAFESYGTDLATGDTNGVADVYVYDRKIAEPVASSTTYGTGFAGSLGIPTLTLSQPPVFGQPSDLLASNSRGTWTAGLLVVGTQRASILTTKGGTLCVVPTALFMEALSPSGFDRSFVTPFDVQLATLAVDAQMLEVDPGAPAGVSFTAGLELVFGN